MSQTLQVCQNVDDAAEKDEATEVLQSDDFQNSPLTWIGREILQKGDALQVATVLTSGCRGFLMCLELFSNQFWEESFFHDDEELGENWHRVTSSRIPQVFPLWQSSLPCRVCAIPLYLSRPEVCFIRCRTCVDSGRFFFALRLDSIQAWLKEHVSAWRAGAELCVSWQLGFCHDF